VRHRILIGTFLVLLLLALAKVGAFFFAGKPTDDALERQVADRVLGSNNKIHCRYDHLESHVYEAAYRAHATYVYDCYNDYPGPGSNLLTVVVRNGHVISVGD
jgi:hypothetical protein